MPTLTIYSDDIAPGSRVTTSKLPSVMYGHRALGLPALALELSFKTAQAVLKRGRISEDFNLLGAVKPPDHQSKLFSGGVKPRLGQTTLRSR